MTSSLRTNEYSDGLSLRDLVAPLFRRKKLLLATFLVTFGAVIALGLLMPAGYRSKMSILVARERHDPLVTTEATTQMPMTGGSDVTLGEINSEAELLQSQDLLEKVVLAAGLADKHGFSWGNLLHPNETKDDRVARAVKNLAKNLKVENQTNSNLINVSYSSQSPQLAWQVLNSLGAFYVEKQVSVHRPAGSYQFFAQQTQRYHDALQESEGRLRNFGKEQGIAAPDIVRTDLAQQMAASVGQFHLAQQSIAGDLERIKSDWKQMAANPKRSPTQQASSPADKLLEDLHAQLLSAETKRTQLALKYDVNYPSVREADQEIAQAKLAIAEAEKTRYITQTTDVDPTYELLREDLARTRADIAGQRAAQVATRQSIKSIQAQMVDLDQKSITQQDLLRETKANEENYLLYLSKREQERTSDALDKTRIANVSVVVPPGIPALPVYSFPLVVAAAGGLAFILSFAVAYASDYYDSSFHSPAQVLGSLDTPVVTFDLVRQLHGNKPLASLPVSGAPSLMLNRDGDLAPWGGDEALRLVQQLFLLQTQSPPRVVVFAGIDRGNGCSRISASVAETLARNTVGPVCLVDANFRSPSLPELFGTTNHYGLSDALRNQGPIRSFAKPVGVNKLWLLSCGELAAGANDLLSSEQVKARLSELREEFHFVIIDAPPLNKYSEAIALGQAADGLVLIVEAEATRREAAQMAVANLRSSQVQLLGCVLNKRTFPIPETIYNKL